MFSEEEIQEIAIEVAKILAKDIYGDALKPGMKQIGLALETVAKLGNTVLTPIMLLNEGARMVRDSILDRWQDKMKVLPEANIKSIDGEIAIPALKSLEYTTSDELVELFLNLLTSASDNRKEGIVHPAFVNIITELSPDEARMLKFMKYENQPICTVHVRVIYNDNSYSDHYHSTTIFDCNEALSFKNNSKAYLENLKRLGLIRQWGIPRGVEQYEIIEAFLEPSKNVIEAEKEGYKNVKFVRGYLDFTEFGNNFINSCLPNE